MSVQNDRRCFAHRGRATLSDVFERVREFRRRYMVTADTTTSGILSRAAWSALAAGLLFGLFSLLSEEPSVAAVQGTSFAVLMIFGFQIAFLVSRARLRRQRDRRDR
ncbi:MAG: hypothetical protein F2817_19165 [Actinobacteria bacterium]|nr:hypothetical protein [Actinomycetota bacterium]